MQLCAQKAWLAISAFSPSDPVRALAVSLFDPSGHRWAMLASPGAGQDGPLLVAKLAQCLQGQKEVLKIRFQRQRANVCLDFGSLCASSFRCPPVTPAWIYRAPAPRALLKCLQKDIT